MGYYSIYLIFKDIIRTLTKKKNLKIFIFILIILLYLFYKKNFSLGADVIDYDSFGVTATITVNDSIANNYNYALFTTRRAYNSTRDRLMYVFMVARGDITMRYNGDYLYFDCSQGISFLGTNGSWTSSAAAENFSNYVNLINNANAPGNWYNTNGSGLLGFINLDNVSYYGNGDIYNTNGDLVYSANTGVKYPSITTSTTDLENLSFEYLSIDTNDFYQDRVYLYIYDLNTNNSNDIEYIPPKKRIVLTTDSDYYIEELSINNATYWIPISDLGLTFKSGGTYGFRFVLSNLYTEDGIEYDELEWLTDYQTFTLNSSLTSDYINSINNFVNNNQQKEQTDILNQIISDDYDENQINNSFNDISSSTSEVDNSQYVGFFTTIFNKLSVIINGDYNSVETISFPIMNTNHTITFRSDLIKIRIEDTFVFTFLQIFWYYLFGMYIFKFSNNLIIKIKSGEILNGYENKNEVITSSML